MSILDRVLGHPGLAALGRWSTRSRLRVLAMHEVRDIDRLDHQLNELLRWFHPVDASQVVRSFRDGVPLGDNAVWVTFDDGDHSTIVDAAALLEQHGVRATAFVCPAFVEALSAPWWDVVSSAVDSGHPVTIDGHQHRDPAVVTLMKSLPDEVRRSIVDQLPPPSGSNARSQVTIEDLRRWRSLGGEIGNHTWDHPCLDQCAPGEQITQIDRAAGWLDDHAMWDHRLFAYPNGDRTDVAEQHLRDAGYDLVALFDHRLTARHPQAHRVSRLRLTAGASPQRTRAVTSGLHSGLFGARDRVFNRQG